MGATRRRRPAGEGPQDKGTPTSLVRSTCYDGEILFPDPLVTIAIPTLAAGPILKSCLRALQAQVFRNFSVVIIDNGGLVEMDSLQPLSFPCQIETPGSNVGFGAAVNLAIRTCSSRYIATINDDTEPEPHWLGALVRAMDSEPAVGMCACRIKITETGAIDSAGMLICFDGSSKQRGQSQPPDLFDAPEDVLFPSGCAAIFRRKMLDEIGLFDEDFFLYCEDTDLGLRARWAGWLCRFVPDAVVMHRYSSTAGAFSPAKAYFVERNRLWVAAKNFPARLLWMLPFVSLTRYVRQWSASRGTEGAAAGFIRSGNTVFTAFGIIARAHWATLLQMPALLRKRSAMRGSRRVSGAEFVSLMNRHRISAKDLARA